MPLMLFVIYVLQVTENELEETGCFLFLFLFLVFGVNSPVTCSGSQEHGLCLCGLVTGEPLTSVSLNILIISSL